MSATRYDFRKPLRLPVEWQHRLSGWYQNACTLANRAWAKQLPVPLEVSVEALDTGFAQEALAVLPATMLGYRVLIAGGRLPTLLVLPRLMMLQIISVMLADNAGTTDRELTLVEDNLADYFLTHLWLPFFRESWPDATLVPWELKEREVNPQASRFFAARDVLLVLPWQIRGPWGTTGGLWFFPKKGILETLGDGQPAPPAAEGEKQLTLRKQALVSNLPLRVDVVLGTADLKLSQLSRLQVGDVLLLDQRNEEGAVAGAGSQPLFRGRVGRVGSWKAFRIEAFVEK